MAWGAGHKVDSLDRMSVRKQQPVLILTLGWHTVTKTCQYWKTPCKPIYGVGGGGATGALATGESWLAPGLSPPLTESKSLANDMVSLSAWIMASLLPPHLKKNSRVAPTPRHMATYSMLCSLVPLAGSGWTDIPRRGDHGHRAHHANANHANSIRCGSPLCRVPNWCVWLCFSTQPRKSKELQPQRSSFLSHRCVFLLELKKK